jgi:hypothetical protein
MEMENNNSYVCSNCGSLYFSWSEKCNECGSLGTLQAINVPYHNTEIESYKASYPLSYYDVGAVYAFYGPSFLGVPATNEQITKYASVLNSLLERENNTAIQPVQSKKNEKNVINLNRFYAVVVEKIRSTNSACIVVMFCNKHNGRIDYYTRKYVVNSGSFLDGSEILEPSTHLDFVTKTDNRVGGITLSNNKPRVGGITKVDHNQNNTYSPAIGGVTRVKTDSVQNQSIPMKHQKVGGITLVRDKKVGGITKIK